MVVRAIGIAKFLLDTVSQAPVIVQVPQTAPEPWWKWLLQTVGPVAGGVWIAWLGSTWNKKRQHEEWIRDRKKEEWRELLKAAAEMLRTVSLGLDNSELRAQRVREGLKSATQELDISAASCVFLSDLWADEAKKRRFHDFLRKAYLFAERIDWSLTQSQYLMHPDPDLLDQERARGRLMNVQERSAEMDAFFNELTEFNDWLRKEAAVSLGAGSYV